MSQEKLYAYKISFECLLEGDNVWIPNHQNVVAGPCALQIQADLVAALKNSPMSADTDDDVIMRRIVDVHVIGVELLCEIHQCQVQALVNAGVINLEDDAEPETDEEAWVPSLEPDDGELPQQPV